MAKHTSSKTKRPARKQGIELKGKMRDPSESEVECEALSRALLAPMKELKDTIGQNYNYPVPKSTEDALFRITKKQWDGRSSFDRNIELRNVLRDENLVYVNSDGSWSLNKSLCRWVVADWGGTDRKDELSKNLEDIILERLGKWHASGKTARSIKLDRVSSWSKILALAFPKVSAIYDSRTAFTLNFLQFQLSQNDESASRFKYWPVPSGKNTLLKLLDFDLFLMIHHVKELDKLIEYEQSTALANPNKAGKSRLAGKVRNEIQIAKSQTYRTYCGTLARLSKELYPPEEEYGLLKTEMLLFSAATQVIPARVAKYVYQLIDGCESGGGRV